MGRIKSMISFGAQQIDENAKVRCIYSQRLQTGCFLEMCYYFNGKISIYSLVLDYFQGEMRIQNQKEIYTAIMNDLLSNHLRQIQNVGSQQQKQVNIKHKFDLIDIQFQYVDEEFTFDCLTAVSTTVNEQSIVFFEVQLKKAGAEIISETLKEFNNRTFQNFYGKLYDPTQKLNLIYYIIFNEEFQQIGQLTRRGQELVHDSQYVDDYVNGIGGISKGLNTIGIYLVEQEDGLKEINQILDTPKDADSFYLKSEQLEEKRIQELNNYIVPAGCNPEIFFNLLSLYQQNVRIEEKVKSLNSYLKKSTPMLVMQTLYMITQEMKKEKTRNIVLAVSCKENDRRKSNQKFNQEEMFSIDNDIILYEINKKLQKLYHFKQFVERSDLRSHPQFAKVINSCIDGVIKAFIAQQIRQLQISGNSRKDLFEEIFEALIIDQNIQDDNQQKSIDRLYINLDHIEFVFKILNQILINSILKSSSYQNDILTYYQIWTNSIKILNEGRQQFDLKRIEEVNEDMSDFNEQQAETSIEENLVKYALIFISKSLELLNARQNNIGQQLSIELQNICDFCLKETLSRNIKQVKEKILRILLDNQLLEVAFNLCLENNLKEDLFQIYFDYNYNLLSLKEYLRNNSREINGFFIKFIDYEKTSYSQSGKQDVCNFRIFTDFQEFNEDITSVLSQYYPNLYILYQTLSRPIAKINSVSHSESIPQNPYDNASLTLFRAMQRNIAHLKENINPSILPDPLSERSLQVRRLEIQTRYNQNTFDYFGLLNLIQKDSKQSNYQKINDIVELFKVEARVRLSQLDNFRLTESSIFAVLHLYFAPNTQSYEYKFIIESLKDIMLVLNILPNQFFQHLSESNSINNISREIRVKIFEDLVKSTDQLY